MAMVGTGTGARLMLYQAAFYASMLFLLSYMVMQ
jgi:hypothetical protein